MVLVAVAFDAEHETLLDHRRLPDIDRAERTHDVKSPSDVGERLLVGAVLAERSLGDERRAKERIGADDAESFRFHLPDER